MKKKTVKRKNPADTTMRNIDALKKRVLKLEVLVEALVKDVSKLWSRAGL